MDRSRRSSRASTGPPSSRRRSPIRRPPSSSGRPPSPGAASTRAIPPAVSMPMGSMAASAANLHALPGWPVKLGGAISTQPVLANNLIYVGAWDGYEYALTPSGAIQWKRFLGITTKGKACQYPIGLAGTAVVARATVNGSERSVLYVGGGGNVDAAGAMVAGGTAQL